jgi:hypothetical protein
MALLPGPEKTLWAVLHTVEAGERKGITLSSTKRDEDFLTPESLR